MQIETKITNRYLVGLVLLAGLVIAGCDMVLPSPKVPLVENTDSPKKLEYVVKHVSLFKQGIAFDILDTNQSWDATGVVTSGNLTTIMNDIMIVEENKKKEPIEKLVTKLNKTVKKGCEYTLQTKNIGNENEIHELSLATTCEDNNISKKIIYIYNASNPAKIIKIQKGTQYAGPRADTAKTKIWYESLTFL